MLGCAAARLHLAAMRSLTLVYPHIFRGTLGFLKAGVKVMSGYEATEFPTPATTDLGKPGANSWNCRWGRRQLFAARGDGRRFLSCVPCPSRNAPAALPIFPWSYTRADGRVRRERSSDVPQSEVWKRFGTMKLCPFHAASERNGPAAPLANI